MKRDFGPRSVGGMIRYLLAIIALSLALPACAADDERAFGRGMLERLQAVLPDTELRIDPADPLAIQMKVEGEWGRGVINTHRIYSFCQSASKEECEAAAEDFATKFSIEPPEPTAADLRVIVRDRVYLDHLLQAESDEEHQTPYRPIGEDLFAILAFDSPNSIALATRSELRELELDDRAAWQLAATQTKAILPPFPSGASLSEHAVVFEEGEYLASLLADTEAWRSIAARAGPDLFVTAVSDYFVFVGVMPDGPDLEDFKQTVREDCEAQQRCVSPNVYRFRMPAG